jgi:hypothetical protein
VSSLMNQSDDQNFEFRKIDERVQVPILRNDTNICNLQCYMLVNFCQYFLAGQVSYDHYESIVLMDSCKIDLTKTYKY